MKTAKTSIPEASISKNLKTSKTAIGLIRVAFIFMLLAYPVCSGFSKGKTQPAQGQMQGTQRQTQPTQGQQPATQGQTQSAQGQTQAAQGQTQPAQGQQPAAQGQTQPAQGQTQAAQGQAQPAQKQTQPTQNQWWIRRKRQGAATEQQDANPDDALLVIDVNPLMWMLSGIPDENNNRSVYFDAGLQFNVLPDISLRINPSISFGFTSESAFTDSHINFVEVEIPITFICFPFYKSDYLWPVFFGVSILNAYHSIMEGDNDGLIVSIGAMVEIGYQMKFSNHLTITPSIGISRLFPKSNNRDQYEAPSFNLYSPWILDTPVAPRIRITIGFWL